MKVNELRVGNWVKAKGALSIIIGKVIEINMVHVVIENDDGYTSLPLSILEPIELTEEVLLKIGFEKISDCYVLQNEYICLAYYKDSFKQELVAGVKRKGKCLCHINELKNYDIKYLHELQNAYYLLTNEELEVEL